MRGAALRGGSFFFSSPGHAVPVHPFVMEWAAIWKAVALGLLIAGALAAWVPYADR
jgi:hypothetical protein